MLPLAAYRTLLGSKMMLEQSYRRDIGRDSLLLDWQLYYKGQTIAKREKKTTFKKRRIFSVVVEDISMMDRRVQKEKFENCIMGWWIRAKQPDAQKRYLSLAQFPP